MKKPFFANFLEEQDTQQVTGGNRVIGGIVALPFPGAGDCKYITDPSNDQFEVTMKYPSDGDEGAELELF